MCVHCVFLICFSYLTFIIYNKGLDRLIIDASCYHLVSNNNKKRKLPIMKMELLKTMEDSDPMLLEKDNQIDWEIMKETIVLEERSLASVQRHCLEFFGVINRWNRQNEEEDDIPKNIWELEVIIQEPPSKLQQHLESPSQQQPEVIEFGLEDFSPSNEAKEEDNDNNDDNNDDDNDDGSDSSFTAVDDLMDKQPIHKTRKCNSNKRKASSGSANIDEGEKEGEVSIVPTAAATAIVKPSKRSRKLASAKPSARDDDGEQQASSPLLVVPPTTELRMKNIAQSRVLTMYRFHCKMEEVGMEEVKSDPHPLKYIQIRGPKCFFNLINKNYRLQKSFSSLCLIVYVAEIVLLALQPLQRLSHLSHLLTGGNYQAVRAFATLVMTKAATADGDEHHSQRQESNNQQADQRVAEQVAVIPSQKHVLFTNELEYYLQLGYCLAYFQRFPSIFIASLISVENKTFEEVKKMTDLLDKAIEVRNVSVLSMQFCLILLWNNRTTKP